MAAAAAASGDAERPFDLGDRLGLGRADSVLGALLLLRRGDLLGQRDDEEAVVAELGRGRLVGYEGDGVADVLQPVLAHLLFGVRLGAVGLRPVGDDLVEQLGGAVVLARLGESLGHREGLAEGAAAVRGGDDHPGAGRALEDGLPLLVGEVCVRRHSSPLVMLVRQFYRTRLEFDANICSWPLTRKPWVASTPRWLGATSTRPRGRRGRWPRTARSASTARWSC